MLEIADQKSVKGLGYIGGVMGPKEFTDSKSYVVHALFQQTQNFLCRTYSCVWKRTQ